MEGQDQKFYLVRPLSRGSLKRLGRLLDTEFLQPCTLHLWRAAWLSGQWIHKFICVCSKNRLKQDLFTWGGGGGAHTCDVLPESQIPCPNPCQPWKPRWGGGGGGELVHLFTFFRATQIFRLLFQYRHRGTCRLLKFLTPYFVKQARKKKKKVAQIFAQIIILHTHILPEFRPIFARICTLAKFWGALCPPAPPPPPVS